MNPKFPLWPTYGLFALIYLIAMHFVLPVALLAALKVLPILLLLALLLRTAGAPRFLWLAVIFSGTGDLLLALPLANGFVLGLGAFLIAQLCYAVGFFRQRGPLLGRAKRRLLFVLVLCAALATLILPNTGPLMLPVAIYLLAIGAMATSAALHSTEQATVFSGALLFVLSDTLIAVNKFLWPFGASGLAIMVTYYLAQILLVTGSLSHARRAG